jgi:hypothetical protein
MDGTKLQTKVYAGYAKAALRIGLDADQHRPTSASNPIAAGTKLRTLKASFNAEDMQYSKPNKYGKATWWGLFDGRVTDVGDYLVCAGVTYFIAAQQPILPILCVACTNTVTIKRPQQQSGVGAIGYGGNTAATETALMTAWPCSILQAGAGEKADAILPGDVKTPSWQVLLPHYTGVTLRSGDIITDDISRRFVLRSAELTDLGWRLGAQQAQT